jgi:lipoate-protein ligase A
VTWAVHRSTGSAAAFHARALPDPVERAVHVFDVERPALVLGSTQADAVADAGACRAAGVEVVRRRSGGGAVLLDPDDVVWVDVELPRPDPLWVDDVGRAAWWVGEAWVGALGELGVGGLEVHRRSLERGRWGELVCFAGLGPGEVTGGGRKVVGLSQRRSRSGARFQCAVPRRWDPVRLAGLLALPDGQRSALAADLAGVVDPVAAAASVVVDAFLRRLPA